MTGRNSKLEWFIRIRKVHQHFEEERNADTFFEFRKVVRTLRKIRFQQKSSNHDNEKGGVSRPSKNADAFFSSSQSDDWSDPSFFVTKPETSANLYSRSQTGYCVGNRLLTSREDAIPSRDKPQ
jgi:hypothetical protein